MMLKGSKGTFFPPPPLLMIKNVHDEKLFSFPLCFSFLSLQRRNTAVIRHAAHHHRGGSPLSLSLSLSIGCGCKSTSKQPRILMTSLTSRVNESRTAARHDISSCVSDSQVGGGKNSYEIYFFFFPFFSERRVKKIEKH